MAIGELPKAWFCLVSFGKNHTHSFVSSSYVLGNDKCEKLSEIPICLRMLSFFRFPLLLLLGIVYSWVYFTAAYGGQQMEIKSFFNKFLLDAYCELSTGADDSVQGRRLVSALHFSNTVA